MTQSNTQMMNADTEDRAYELSLMLNNVRGADDIGYYPDGEGTTVSLWAPRKAIDTACDMAESKGFTEGFIVEESEDGSRLKIEFSQ